MSTYIQKIMLSFILISLTTILAMSSLIQTSAVYEVVSENKFLVYQLQTGSPDSASSELVSIINSSNKPQRLHGLCVAYSAASSINWSDRACFSDPDDYTQLWLVSGGVAYVATDAFISSNPSFNRDWQLTSGMAASGGAIKLVLDGADIDIVGWGTSNFYETSAISAPANSELVQRKVDQNTVVDTDNNTTDFNVLAQGIVAQSGVFEVEIPRDMCQNISGLQESIPIGYDQLENECFIDQCLNIDGLQTTTIGYEVDEFGACSVIQLEDSTLSITEVLPNVAGVDDGKEFIELYNPNQQEVNIAGYKLTTGSDLYVLSDFILKPKTYVAVYDSTSGITLPNANGVEVVLIAPSGREVSRSALYANAPDDHAWISISGQWQFTNQPTPGAENKVSLSSSIGGESASGGLAPCPEGKERNPLTNRCRTIVSTTTLVPCDADEFRNPATNRCNKLRSTTSSLKPCSAGQERNPETNRCRAVSSTSDLQPCPEGKERNPETNRCRTLSVLSANDEKPGQALTATIVDVPVPGTGVNWAIISTAIVGSLIYILYEWRSELTRAVATIRSYRYN